VGDLEDRCISHEVEDGPDIRNLNRKGEPVFHGLLDSQLQKLRDKVELQEQEQKNQRCLRDIIALLLGCVLALLFVICMIFMIYTMLTQKLSDEPSEATTLLPATFILNASGFGGHINLNLLVPVTRTSKYERRSFRNDQPLKHQAVSNALVKRKVEDEVLTEQERSEREDIEQQTEKMNMIEFEKMMRRQKRWEEPRKDAKSNPSTSGIIVVERESEPKLTPELEVQSAQLPRASVDAEGRTQRVINEDPESARADAEDAEDRDSDEREDHEDLWNKPIDVGVVTEDPAEGERRESIKAALDKTSPFTDHNMRTSPPLPYQSHGVVWVCFPAGTFQHDVEKYAPVFTEIARSQRWMVYPFCFVDTRKLEDDEYGEHFCDNVKKLTFVMEKSTSTPVSEVEDMYSSTSYIPAQTRFDECRHYMETSPEYFRPIKTSKQSVHRRTFQPDQDIQASVVEDFLNDVHSGKLPEVSPAKGDL